MKNFFNVLAVVFASLIGYAIASRFMEETRDFR